MPVKNVELTSIEARRFSRPQERIMQVRVDHNSTVTVVREAGPQEANIEFRYTASYGGVGIIRLEGQITFACDAMAITKQWSETAQMPSDMASEVHTTVMRVCVPEAVGIAKNLKLPLPIP
ncbi:MAG TPA: hypothetical protein VNZ52_11755, partial [Candidatus Thermoplasmatota archaeon]|nr:hypothetical protein [Candidatus Thermoplasmatota archaeon]